MDTETRSGDAEGLPEPGPDMAEPESPDLEEEEDGYTDGTGFERYPEVEKAAEEYGIDEAYDLAFEQDLPDGAVAATAKIPGVRVEEIEEYEDLLNYEEIAVDEDGDVYGLERDELIGFIADSEVYSDLDYIEREHVNLHELNHLEQFTDGLWGDSLDEEYNLSDSMRQQLNYVDRLQEVSEDPILGSFIDDGVVTALVEGYTQRVTEAIQPEGEEIGEDFYPGYTAVADYLMQVNGTDPEKEFDPEIDAEKALEPELEESGNSTEVEG